MDQVLDTLIAVDADVRLEDGDELGGRVVAAFHAMSASLLGLFDLIIEMDTTEGFLPTYQNTAVWLRWHLGVKSSTARPYVRLARGLAEFPLFREAFAADEISADQLGLVLRVATSENEALLVELVAGSVDSTNWPSGSPKCINNPTLTLSRRGRGCVPSGGATSSVSPPAWRAWMG